MKINLTYNKTLLKNSFVNDIDLAINSKRKKYADYHKSVFHIHTPASHDYRLFESLTAEKYTELSNEDLFRIAIKELLFPENSLTFEEAMEIANQNNYFETLKEYLTYLLIAKKLADENVKLAVITDHNTISGYEKLVNAIDIINNSFSYKIYTDIFLGIEISCADKCHVVGIFDAKEETISLLNNWIYSDIMDCISGTYQTSLNVLTKINEFGGIGYIAHINSSDIFKPDFLSGGYKDRLFNSIDNKLLGVSHLDNIPRVMENLKRYTKWNYNFVLDEDSHSLDNLATKPFWIKGQKVNFTMLKNAIRDFEISTEYKEPEKPNVFIKGIVVEEDGFLSGINGNGNFGISFSESLNCFIGGRGTGKSTVLNTINFVLSQNVYDEKALENICNQGRVCVVCSYNGEDYYIIFNTPKMDKKQYTSILGYFNNDLDNYKYDKKFIFDPKKIKDISIERYIQLFKKTIIQNQEYIEEITRNKKSLLSNFFYRRYSVNELVRTSSSDEITDFIREMMFKNEVLSDKRKVGNITTIKGLKQKYKELPAILKDRKITVHNTLDSFNANHVNQLKITYYQNNINEFILNWVEILEVKMEDPDNYFEKFNIKIEDLIEYLSLLSEKSDPINVFLLLSEKNYNKILDLENIKEHTSSLSKKQVNEGIVDISSNNVTTFFDIIRRRVLENGLPHAVELIKNYLLDFDEFDLEFNINNMEMNKPVGKIFKSVKELSLGQKVVAMLSFILSYSDFSNDYTPLIIDQPEDNLDNRYIYKNLVSDLRKAKSKRQVIIATHNSTIVTNSKAEQVIVMASNNTNGWVEATGYPTEKSILLHIVNLLEGGVESFKHKQFLYQDILDGK
ncbi:Spaf_1101 family AAA-like ATPase [Bacillus kwashiorkori]|uniref:Spaf_1101 family AAA-like ATPase n=1 Tax=Bacillus kwashiorkori TaxID=1522318 RepID=UPI003083FC29